MIIRLERFWEAGEKYSMSHRSPVAATSRSSLTNFARGNSTLIVSAPVGISGAIFASAVDSGPFLLAPGNCNAVWAITEIANSSAVLSFSGRENKSGTSAMTMPLSIYTSINASGVYGGTPQTEAISKSSINSDSVRLNCLAIVEIFTRLRCIIHGNITRSPVTR
ncbi:unannotated protein [freshwater metagenome]|uniref:Unannotated protein n=1 Tax=freshwater metagenome TaxID=449393 RepID=A0A6J6YFW0_9ZZZZ